MRDPSYVPDERLDSACAETAVEKRALVEMMCLLGGQPHALSEGDLPDVSPLALLVTPARQAFCGGSRR